MMEKRNFVTSARTPMEGASDIDDIVSAGTAELRRARQKSASAFEKKACAEDEKSDMEI
jgi:hypothetical protein